MGAVLPLSAHAAEATPGASLKCTGIEERQVRDVVPTDKGALKMGEYGEVQKIPETFEQIFKAKPFRVVVKDNRSVTSTQSCELKGREFTCLIEQPGSKATHSIVFNLDSGAYASVSETTLIKSSRAGTCDMTDAKALLAAAH